MKDPAFLVETTFEDVQSLLSQSFESKDELKRAAFEKFLSAYEGFDILEVICREAAVLCIYDEENDRIDSVSNCSLEKYFKKLSITVDKYARSESWPKIETDRARVFGEYIARL